MSRTSGGVSSSTAGAASVSVMPRAHVTEAARSSCRSNTLPRPPAGEGRQGMRGCWPMLARVVCGACAMVLLSSSVAAAAPVKKQGYIPMADGTKLEYTADLPSATGRYPVAMVYDGYCEGAGATGCNDPATASALLARGYAVLGVSIRGTSCSTGTFDAMTPQEWSDGAAAIEWAARQPWSNGHLGMFGDSFPGITQVGVAGLRPAHLDAIAPFQVATDIYRDAGFPGGIQNTGFGAFWAGFDQPDASYRSGVGQAAGADDVGCAQAQATHAGSEPMHN